MLGSLGLTLLCALAPATWTFDADPVGRLPEGFTSVASRAPEGHFVVQRGHSGRVLSQTDAARDPYRWLFALAPATKVRDAQLGVDIRLTDPNAYAGLAFRYQDPENHYVVRLSSRRRDIRLYRVTRGNRVALRSERDVDLEVGEWFALQVVIRGDEITVRLGGVRLFDLRDEALPAAGRFGIWAEGGIVADFDDLVLKPLCESETPAPSGGRGNDQPAQGKDSNASNKN